MLREFWLSDEFNKLIDDNGFVISPEAIGNETGVTKEVFDRHLSSLTMDDKFFKRINDFVQEFKYRNDDHINFFGSNLTGVYPVRFKSVDKQNWIDGILDIDEHTVRREIIQSPAIKETWIRGTDVMNLSCFYLVHRIGNNKNLPKDKQYEAAKNVLLALHFKLIGSLMAHYFKFNVDERIAQLTYAQLTKKFSIKQLGTWYRVLEARCDDILSPNSIHARTLERFNDDAAIQNMITDVQGRLKAMIKNIWAVMEQVRNSDQKMMSTTGHIELEGKMVMRDLVRKDTQFIRYLHEISPDENRFIKRELVDVIDNTMQTMPADFLIDSLNHICRKMKKGDAIVTKLLDEVILHAIEVFNKDRFAKQNLNDMANILCRFRALYMASRAKEANMLEMRSVSEKLVAESIKSRNPTVIASVRTGVLLYILLRALTMDHYENK